MVESPGQGPDETDEVGVPPAVPPSGSCREPLVLAHEVGPEDSPSAVASLAARMGKAGWTVRLTRAVGYELGAGPDAEPVETVAIRAKRGARSAVAVWDLGTSATGRPSAKASSAYLDRRSVGARAWSAAVLGDLDDEAWADVTTWVAPNLPHQTIRQCGRGHLLTDENYDQWAIYGRRCLVCRAERKS